MDGQAPIRKQKGIDVEALRVDLDALRKQLETMRGPADIAQFRRLELFSWALFLAALGTSVWGVNPLSPVLFALAAGSRWMILGHHLSHGALDGVAGAPKRMQPAHFAQGWMRWWQWPDWLDPAAWHREHNQLHHAYTNEAADPDVVANQTRWIRESALPMPLRYLLVLVVAITWRFAYYAPNTAACLESAERSRKDAKALADLAPSELPFNPLTPAGKRAWLHSWLPFALFQFGLVPALVLPFGLGAWQAALVHVAIAEVLAGLYTFVVIVPNHAGDDLVKWDQKARGKGQWYVHQILGSTNYATGGKVNDWLHGYLNYQIEHHLWPDMTPRQYAAAAPQVREICARHGIAYVQQSVWARLGKMLDIAVGKTQMLPEPVLLTDTAAIADG